MEISQKAKDDLKQIHLKHTGEKLIDQETEEMAQDLFCLFDVIYKPLPNKNESNKTSL